MKLWWSRWLECPYCQWNNNKKGSNEEEWSTFVSHSDSSFMQEVKLISDYYVTVKYVVNKMVTLGGKG